MDLKKKAPEAVDVETIKMIDKHFKEAKNYRKDFEDDWREYEDFYNGKHWKDKNRSFKNLIFPLIEQEVAVLSDALPSTDILSVKDDREEDAKALEASVHFTYEQQGFFLKLVMALRGALKTGTAFHYVDFDPDLDNGQGLTTIKNIPWDQVYLDPAATEIDEACFVGIKFPTRVSEAKRKFPKFKDKIKASGKDSEGSLGSNAMGLHEDKANYTRGSSNPEERFELDDMCIIEECWIRDFDMIDIPEDETIKEIKKETEQFFNSINPDITRFEDHDAHNTSHEAQLRAIVGEALGINPALVTEQDIEGLKSDQELGLIIELIQDHMKIHDQYKTINPDGKRPKYDKGLRLVIKIGSLIVYDGSPPVNDGMVPLVPYYCYKGEESIWGTGEIKNILPAQKSFNEMDNAEYESLHLTSNPGWVMESDCGVSPSSISNKRGKVYVINKGSQFRRLEPGQTSPQLTSRKQGDQQFMQIITGLNEASQGRQPGGVTAAKAIERLQQQTNGRIRLKSSTLSLYSMPRMGKLVASRNAKYWTTERLMRITDDSTGSVRLVKFSPDQVKDLAYDVRTTQSSLAGTDKEAQNEVLAAYVEKGWLPPKVYFQISDVPNKKKILEALNEADEQRMMLEQLQAENEQLKQLINGAPVEPNMPTQEAIQE